MADDKYQADLAAWHERMIEESNARIDEHIRRAKEREAERKREERAQDRAQRARTHLLCELGGVALARGITTADQLGAALDAAGWPEQRRRRR